MYRFPPMTSDIARPIAPSAGVNAGRLVVVTLRADGPRERAARVLVGFEGVKHSAEVVPWRPAQVRAGTNADVDAADRREHPPALADVLRLVAGEQPQDHRGRVVTQPGQVGGA